MVAAWIFAALLVLSTGRSFAGEGPCLPVTFKNSAFVACTIDLRSHELKLFWKDASGEPYATFSRLPEEMDGAPLVFAMNAGMYHADLSPVGLHVEDGETLKRASTRDGPGNFHLKPNGVFFISGGAAAVLPTEDYLDRAADADLATQSGPMLVIDGEFHPRFLPRSTSRKRRNGVGVREDGTVVFAISQGTVTFWEFAELFRDHLGCDNALFLDGSMSSLYAPDLGRADAIRPMGPIIAAFARN